ncbi:lipoyl(octanoyl) transferase [Amycolatopsis cynarae]|uniref:Lipoyl(Octanoyl) transferase n=1 Tax=Amycolatopsis cynarae TaxID=2995223 RepID=A0ABY7B3L6_9PSEU|nr:lipoyl(octanoyl) transferase [Amycolatopsis sp. HUAS 11-8]WAL66910.1 lipoyl(octanoyl) transferase [Amycolatopsis sp. HUAS 11-8]
MTTRSAFPDLTRVDLGEIPYATASEWMRAWVAECQEGREGDRLFLLSHPVVTFGPRTSPVDLPSAASGLPTVPVDRGGQATYHGPGQLVGGPSLVGVWTPDHRKVASIGMRIRGGVSSHGFCVNVAPDMAVFDSFVSCGLSEPMTSLAVLAAERDRPAPGDGEVRDALAAALGAHR